MHYFIHLYIIYTYQKGIKNKRNMKIHSTGDATIKPSVVMMIYGQGGVGKTTFCATAPKPIIADCENGSKYFGLRGIKVDVGDIAKWTDINDFYKFVQTSDHETIIVDPIGELMEKLKTYLVQTGNKKFVQSDGSLTMNGWGEMKDRMRQFIKSVRDLNKHLIIVAHVEEKDDEGKLIKRPKIMTKMSEELVAMVDVVGFMEVIKTTNDNGEIIEKRVIRVQPSDKYESKDRTGQLGGVIESDFTKIINACQGNEVYAWSSKTAKEVNKENDSLDKLTVNNEYSITLKNTMLTKLTSMNTFDEILKAIEKVSSSVKLLSPEKEEVLEQFNAKLLKLTSKVLKEENVFTPEQPLVEEKINK